MKHVLALNLACWLEHVKPSGHHTCFSSLHSEHAQTADLSWFAAKMPTIAAKVRDTIVLPLLLSVKRPENPESSFVSGGAYLRLSW